MMRLLLLPLFPIWIFAMFLVGSIFIEFCEENSNKWWGGAPLWMAGGAGVLTPVFFLGLLFIASLIWS